MLALFDSSPLHQFSKFNNVFWVCFSSLCFGKMLIIEENPSIDIFNIDFFKARLKSLKKAFPEDFFLHAMALKGKFYHYFAKNKNKEFQ